MNKQNTLNEISSLTNDIRYITDRLKGVNISNELQQILISDIEELNEQIIDIIKKDLLCH